MTQFLPLFKALHIIGFVVWFAGLFYLVRMFVYHREAFDKKEPQRTILATQFNLMQWRIYRIICNPGMVITWVFGILMIAAYGMEWFSVNSWLHVKLFFVVLLTGYHHYAKSIILKLEKEEVVMSSHRFRLLNEIPSILLLAIVLLAVYKNNLNYGIALASLLAFALVIVIFTKLYKSIRGYKNQN